MPQLTDMADLAAQYVNSTDRHIFLTGKAGTGKTTFLKEITQKTYKNVVVAAPTGIAAINAGGVTLHSLLQLPFGVFVPENIDIHSTHQPVNTPQTLFREFRINKTKREMIRQLELLIIDEVSMLRADLLDCIDSILRHLRRNKDVPFGGLQILFIGDLLQLPPVVKDRDAELLNKYYPSPYFFNARALQANPPILVELQKVFRQTDDRFLNILNRMRSNQQTPEDLDTLNGHFVADTTVSKYDGYIRLTTHNAKADSINASPLKDLPGKAFSYKAEISGDFAENLYPTIEELVLKEGAQVMFIKNDPSGEGRYFNGKIGRVSNLGNDHITVQFEEGTEVPVDPHEWENKRYTLNKNTQEIEEKFLGKFVQYPLKLAWAVTIHKSQGLTFEKAILDLSGTFAPGQLYVALSRLTSLDGLVLSSKLPIDPPGIDESIEDLLRENKSIDELSSSLQTDKKETLARLIEKAFSMDDILRFLYYHQKGFDKAENRSIKQQFLGWTQDLTKDTRSLDEVGGKFVKQAKGILETNGQNLGERMAKAQAYFSDQIEPMIELMAKHRKEMQKQNRTSTYVKELKELEGHFTVQLSQIKKVAMFVAYDAQDKVLTKQDLHTAGYYPEKKPKKKDKTPTTEISYNLFLEGKSIAEIAKERDLVASTIEGHLCKYVKSGDIEITKLLDQSKIDKILKRYDQGIDGLGELKSDLGDDVSYGEIKLTFAHREWMESMKLESK